MWRCGHVVMLCCRDVVGDAVVSSDGVNDEVVAVRKVVMTSPIMFSAVSLLSPASRRHSGRPEGHIKISAIK